MASKERFSEEYNDVEIPIEIKEEKIEIFDHLNEVRILLILNGLFYLAR